MQKKSSKMDSNVIVLDSSDDEGNSHSTISRKNILKQQNGNINRLINPMFLEKAHGTFDKLQLNGIRNDVSMHKLAETDADISSLLDDFIDEHPDCIEEIVKEEVPLTFFESDSTILKNSEKQNNNNKRKLQDTSAKEEEHVEQKKIRRIAPTMVSCTVTNTCMLDGGVVEVVTEQELDELKKETCTEVEPLATSSSCDNKPIHPTFQLFLETCREADPSSDMDALIKNKIMRYYNQVHTNFTSSKSFCRAVSDAIEAIKQNKTLLYLKISPILEELRIRKVAAATEKPAEEPSPEETQKDRKIAHLNAAFTKLNRKIKRMEQAEVNLDDDQNSIYMVESRCKKRAALIYEKICDLTGESKNACRLVHKPLSFNGTPYNEFNKTIQAFINKTRRFPDYTDVLRALRHCNDKNEYNLTDIDMKKIAQDAFLRIGKSLQMRRRTDLYETVAFFSGTNKDPALDDPVLMAKLEDNKKYQKRIGEIIDKFAKEQDMQKTIKTKAGDPLSSCLGTDGSSSSSSSAKMNNTPKASSSKDAVTHIILSDDDEDDECHKR